MKIRFTTMLVILSFFSLFVVFLFEANAAHNHAANVVIEKSATFEPEKTICAAISQGKTFTSSRLHSEIVEFWKDRGNAWENDSIASCIHVAQCFFENKQYVNSLNLIKIIIDNNHKNAGSNFPYKKSLYALSGIIHNTIGNYKESVFYLEQAAHAAEDALTLKTDKSVLINRFLFTSYVELEKYPAAENLMNDVFAEYLIDEETSEYTFLFSYIAMAYRGLGKDEAALFFAKTALTQARSQAHEGLLDTESVVALAELVDSLDTAMHKTGGTSPGAQFVERGSIHDLMNAKELNRFCYLAKTIERIRHEQGQQTKDSAKQMRTELKEWFAKL